MYKSVLAGGVAGVAEITCMYPTDVMKTRAQLSATPLSMLQTSRIVLKEAGVVGFYRGIHIPIAAEAPKRAWKFGSKDFFSQHVTAHAAIAGALAGASEAIVNCPFETVKVNLQANPELRGSAAACYRALVAEGGHTALYRGFEAQAYRNCLWNGLYFGVIGMLPAPEGADKATTLAHKFVVGTCGSMLGTVANTPFDVAKSRMQFGSGKACLPTIMDMYAEGGVRALYKGLGPRLVRLGPGGGIMIVAYDQMMAFLG